MSQVFVGAIADDDTGATDLAGMLTAQGMRVILVLADAAKEDTASWASDCDAVVVGTASRSIPKREAYARTYAAAKLLQELQVQRIALKYCSTFDSTAEGNIGASLDALLDATGENFIVALPALPALGRTTYMGYHFVAEQLLSDSVLRHHPLNPMNNAHLPSHLQTQTARRVGLATYRDMAHDATALRAKLSALADDGVEIAMLDCVDEVQLAVIGDAIQSHMVFSGSSAWAMVLPQLWKRSSAWKPNAHCEVAVTRDDGGSGMLIVSGSCSEATRRQNEWAASEGLCVIDLDASELALIDRLDDVAVALAVSTLRGGETCVVTTARFTSKDQMQVPSPRKNMSALTFGERISAGLTRTVQSILKQAMPQGLIVAGGETSSTLMRGLGLGGLRVGQNIEAGVPVCVSLAKPSLAVVLKSGNFGSVDFYGRTVNAIAGLRTSGRSTKDAHD